MFFAYFCRLVSLAETLALCWTGPALHIHIHGTPSLATGPLGLPTGRRAVAFTPTRCSLGLLFESGRAALCCVVVPLPRALASLLKEW